jgi:hypothetical protein
MLFTSYFISHIDLILDQHFRAGTNTGTPNNTHGSALMIKVITLAILSLRS